MNILIPMAGAGSRFVDAGYTVHKPILPLTSSKSGKRVPMVVAAVEDLPVDVRHSDNQLTFIIRDFHAADGVQAVLSQEFPGAAFIEIGFLTEGQASTCLLARGRIDTNEPLLISACDNGIDVDARKFASAIENSDAVVFTFRGNDAVSASPSSYGWMRTEETRVTEVSIKKPISDQPTKDHAVVGTFWFRRGSDFVRFSDEMIAANDRVNGEFYVDQVIGYFVRSGLRVTVLEVERYICWGTPDDYANYEQTIQYWRTFLEKEQLG